MGVEVDERQRAVHGRRGAQLGQHHRVVAAQAERRDAGGVHRRQERLDPPQRLLVVARHGRRVAVVDQRQVLGDVDPSSGLYGRSRADALRMPSGPNRAPDLYDTASSVGMPITATSTSSVVCTDGSRMNVRTPVKRGVWDESAGP